MSTVDYSFRARNNRRQGRALTNFKTDNPYTSLGFPTTDSSMATSARNGRGLFYTNGAAQVETPTASGSGPEPEPPVGVNWVVYGINGAASCALLNGTSLSDLSSTALGTTTGNLTNVLYANSIWVLGGPSANISTPPNSVKIFYGNLYAPPEQVADYGINGNITNIFYENSNWVIVGNASDGTNLTSSVVIQGASLDNLSPVTLGIGPIVNAVYTNGTWVFGGTKLTPNPPNDNSTVLLTNTLDNPSPLSVSLAPYNMATLTNLLYLNNTWLIGGTRADGTVLLLSGSSLLDLTTLDLTGTLTTIQNILYEGSTWVVYGTTGSGKTAAPVILQGSSLTNLTAVTYITGNITTLTNVVYGNGTWAVYGLASDNTAVIYQGTDISSLTSVDLTGKNIGTIRNIVYTNLTWFVTGTYIISSSAPMLQAGTTLSTITPVDLSGFDITSVDGIAHHD